MSASSGDGAPPDLAGQLHRDCARLAQCLTRLRAMPPEQLEEGWLRFEEAAEALRSRIERACQALERNAEVALAEELDGARRKLRQIAAGSGELAARVAELRGEVQRRLGDVQRGGRALRSYADAARR
jgi:hypothetical protein